MSRSIYLLLAVTWVALIAIGPLSTASRRQTAADERPRPLCGVHPPSSVFRASAPACNLPSPPTWPPDGCPDYAAVAPPATPIPPPCIRTARVRRWNEAGAEMVELAIYVEHPELGPDASTYTKLARYAATAAGSIPDPPSEIRAPQWELVDLDWEVSCGKDEGPLTWATLQILNGHAAAGLAIYQRPLPDGYVARLLALRARSHRYLPLIQR